MRPNKYNAYDHSGKFNKRATILRPPKPEEKDEAGQPLDEWQPLATVWAAINPLRGREFFAAQAVNSEVTTRIRVRGVAGIDRKMIVTCKGREFEILYLLDIDLDGKEMHLMCKERQ